MKFPRIELWGILFILFLFISMTAFSNQLVDLKIKPRDGSIDIVLCFDTLPTEYSTESDISFENFQIKFPNYTSGLLYRNLQVWISPIYEINVETQGENLKLSIRLVFPRKPKIRMEGKSVILNFKRSTKRADFIFPDWDIRMVIRYISEMLGISMIVDPNLNLGGKVSMNLRNITAEDAFIYLLKTYDDLGYVILPDGTIFLSDFNNLVKRFGDKVLVWRVYDFSDYSESAKEMIKAVINDLLSAIKEPTEKIIMIPPESFKTITIPKPTVQSTQTQRILTQKIQTQVPPKTSSLMVFMKARLEIHSKLMNLISNLSKEKRVKRKLKVVGVDMNKLKKMEDELKKLFNLDKVEVLKETGYIILEGKLSNVEDAVNYIQGLGKKAVSKTTTTARKVVKRVEKYEIVNLSSPLNDVVLETIKKYYPKVSLKSLDDKSLRILILGTSDEINGVKRILRDLGYMKTRLSEFVVVDPEALDDVLKLISVDYPSVVVTKINNSILYLKGSDKDIKGVLSLINQVEEMIGSRKVKTVKRIISLNPKKLENAKSLLLSLFPNLKISEIPDLGIMIIEGPVEDILKAVDSLNEFIEDENIGVVSVILKAMSIDKIKEFLSFKGYSDEILTYYVPETHLLLLKGDAKKIATIRDEIASMDNDIYMERKKAELENQVVVEMVRKLPQFSTDDVKKIITTKFPTISFDETEDSYVLKGKKIDVLRAKDEITALRRELNAKKLLLLAVSEDVDMKTVKKIINLQFSSIKIVELGDSKLLLKGDEFELKKVKDILSYLGLLGKVERKRTVRLYETEDIDFEEAKKLLNIYFPKLTVDYLEKAKMIVLVGSSDDVAGAVAVLKKMEPKYIRKEEEGEEKLKGMIKINPDGTFDLSIRDMTVEEVFRYLADKLGKNVMFGIPMEEKLVIDSKGLRWEDFLKLLEKNFGYVFEEVAGVLTVKKRETAPKPEGKKYIYKVGYNINEIKSLVEYFGGSAYVDEKNNLLIVTGIDEEQKKKLDEFIEELSAPPPQVSIEARMVDKNLTDSILKDLGIEIAMTNPTVKVSKDGVNIYTGVMSELEFAKFMEKFTETLQASATLNANKSDSQGETLSSPHIMTLSGNAAKILVGQRVPYIVSVGEEQEALQFIDIGMELNITPYVRADGTIELDVSAKVSNVVSWKKGRNGEDLPVESTREARTKVVIKDGETLVIGGLTTKDQSDSISKLPILGDLPFVGQLFRTVSKRDEKRELVIFITAKIAKR